MDFPVSVGAAASAYLELTKPRIVLLLLVVAVSAYVASSPATVSVTALLLLAGAGALSSAGSSALNHYMDRDLDGVMARTKNRPLPTERIRPPWKAVVFGGSLLTAGVLLSLLFLNALTAFFVALGALVYLGVYTWALKRRHWSNIVIGGFAGSCPALAGSAAAVNVVTVPALLIAFLVFLWTPGHFWALSLRNREDYTRAGVPMLPAVVSEGTAARAVVVSTLLVASYLALFYFVGGIALLPLLPAWVAGGVLLYLTVPVLNRPRAAWASFRFSGVFLLVTLLAVAGGSFFS